MVWLFDHLAPPWQEAQLAPNTARPALASAGCGCPSGKLQGTLSVRPSGWQEWQLDQALSEALPRKARGTMSRIGMSSRPLSGVPRAVKKVSFPTSTACAKVPGVGGVPIDTSRSITRLASRSIAVTERLTSLFT